MEEIVVPLRLKILEHSRMSETGGRLIYRPGEDAFFFGLLAQQIEPFSSDRRAGQVVVWIEPESGSRLLQYFLQDERSECGQLEIVNV